MVLFSFIYLFSSIGTRFRIATKSPIPTLVACSTLTFGLAFVCCVFLFVFVFVYVFFYLFVFFVRTQFRKRHLNVEMFPSVSWCSL